MQPYRDCEQAGREFNAELIDRDQQALRKPLDGCRYAIQLADTYAHYLNFSGQLDDRGQPDTSHKDPETAFKALNKIAEVEKLIPAIGNSFGRTWLLIAFIHNPQADKLEIAKKCYTQIHGKSPNLASDRGHWHGGEIFEFWTQPLSDHQKLIDLIEAYPHTIVWLFPIDRVDQVHKLNVVISKTYHHWIKLFHYRHKIFYAYHRSQNTVKDGLKNSGIREIADQLKSDQRSLPHLQNILLNSLDKFQEHTDCIQFLEFRLKERERQPRRSVSYR